MRRITVSSIIVVFLLIFLSTLPLLFEEKNIDNFLAFQPSCENESENCDIPLQVHNLQYPGGEYPEEEWSVELFEEQCTPLKIDTENNETGVWACGKYLVFKESFYESQTQQNN